MPSILHKTLSVILTSYALILPGNISRSNQNTPAVISKPYITILNKLPPKSCISLKATLMEYPGTPMNGDKVQANFEVPLLVYSVEPKVSIRQRDYQLSISAGVLLTGDGTILSVLHGLEASVVGNGDIFVHDRVRRVFTQPDILMYSREHDLVLLKADVQVQMRTPIITGENPSGNPVYTVVCDDMNAAKEIFQTALHCLRTRSEHAGLPHKLHFSVLPAHSVRARSAPGIPFDSRHQYIDAPLKDGNSGSPVFDVHNCLVGIITSSTPGTTKTNETIPIAGYIPSTTIRSVIQQYLLAHH